jgi:hypothetical protein
MNRVSILITFLAVSLHPGCSKEEDAVTTSSGFTAVVDGVKWHASKVEASVFNGTIFVSGRSSDGRTISISLFGDSTGLYPVNSGTSNSAAFGAGSSSPELFTSAGDSTAGGQILIESIVTKNRKITGSVEFKAVRSSDDSSVSITSGRFINITYSTESVGTTTSTMQVKVDGNQWVAQDVSGFTAFNTLYLSAADLDGQRELNFELPVDIGPGKYVLNYFTNYRSLYTDLAGVKFYAVQGILEVESHDLFSREIRATFNQSMEAHEEGGAAVLSEGAFNISYD